MCDVHDTWLVRARTLDSRGTGDWRRVTICAHLQARLLAAPRGEGEEARAADLPTLPILIPDSRFPISDYTRIYD